MPHYFFNIDGESPDSDGLELPDFAAARSQAITTSGEMLRDLDGEWTGDEWSMTVDEGNRRVLTLSFREKLANGRC